MKLMRSPLLILVIFSFIFTTGCDNNDDGDSFLFVSREGSVSTVPGATPPNTGGGGGGGSGSPATIDFVPASPQVIGVGTADSVITVVSNPGGGTLSLANIVDGGTGGTFVLGPGADQFTFTTSATTTSGIATVDVTYTPPIPFLPVTQTYTADVQFGPPATVTVTPPGPVLVPVGSADLVVSVIGSPSGGTLSLSNIVDPGTGGTFVLGPAADEFTFTTSTTVAVGSPTVDVTYTPPLPNQPVTITYQVDVSPLSFTSGFLGLPFGRAALPATVTDSINITGLPVTVTDVRVRVDILHSFTSQIVPLSLSSPTGSTVTLVTGAGGLVEGYGVIFSDAAAVSISPWLSPGTPNNPDPFPEFSPMSPLSAFDGEDPNGDWTLSVTDTASGSGVGVLNEWALALNGDPMIPRPPAPTNPAMASGTSVTSGTVNVLFGLPFVGIPATSSSTISVSGIPTITDVRVLVDIRNEFLGSLSVTLSSPGGTTTTLASGFSSAASDLGVILDDSAIAAVTSLTVGTPGNPMPFGEFIPTTPLSLFDGEDPTGDWILSATDTFSSFFLGSINSWGLAFNGDTSIF